ncbi:copper resistance protein CopC [Catellatospora vulcania]|uniref:copper resistance protein CopC n=1 Tax=Catellatospora vulcania TaxID=1460450 RepID=UPI0018B00C50|nr:copper resistance protein CopC [Catellatospora vulcania]
MTETHGRGATGKRTSASRPALAAFVIALVAVGAPALLTAEPAPVRLAAVDPAADAVLAAVPESVALRFTGDLAAREVHVTVADATGATVSAGQPTLSGGTVTTALGVGGPGAYLVVYHLLLDDGRSISGTSRFAVDPAAPPAAPNTADAAVALADTGHAHVPAPDPLNLVLTAVAAVLILALLALLFTRPAVRD